MEVRCNPHEDKKKRSLDDILHYLVTGDNMGHKHPGSLRKARGIVLFSLSALLAVMGGSMIKSSYDKGKEIIKEYPPVIKRISEIEEKCFGFDVLNKIYNNTSDYEYYKTLVKEYNNLNTLNVQKQREELDRQSSFYEEKGFNGFFALVFGFIGGLYTFHWFTESK